MIKRKRMIILSLVAILILGVLAAVIWMKAETERSMKLSEEFSNKVRSSKLKPVSNQIKLHIGDFMLIKTGHDIYAFKVTELKSSFFTLDWDEVNFECYSYNDVKDKSAHKFTLNAHGKVRTYYLKIKRGSSTV